MTRLQFVAAFPVLFWLVGLSSAAEKTPGLHADVEFATPDGGSLTLDAFVPEGRGPFPTCILVHGGGFTKGDKQTFIKPLFEPLSKAGFAWFTINYRLAPQHRWPACADDVEAAIRWVRAHAAEYKVDPARIALVGESAGGHLVSYVGARGRAETRVAAVVPFYAPHDLELQVRSRGELGTSMTALLGLTELNDAAWSRLKEASPSTYIASDLPPYLLIHGDQDPTVPYEQSVRFQKQTRAAGNTCDLITIAGGVHGMGGWSKLGSDYSQQMIAWLQKTMPATRNAPAASGVATTAPRRPNFVVMLVDDLGYGDLGIHGAREIATPHIDSLARQGVQCTSGYVSGPYCSPTRAGLLTGRYQQRFGHEFNPSLLANGGAGQGLAVSETTLATRLQQAGYATGLVGKWHLGEEPQFHPQQRGFQHFFGFLTGSHSYLTSEDAARGPIYRGREKVPFTGYLTDVLAQEAGTFLQTNKDRPFCLYLAFNAVHTPMHAPDEALAKFSGESNEQRRTYLAMLSRLDAAVGHVLTRLHDLGLDEHTLVFFLSDNGGPTTKFAANGSRNPPLRGSKGDTWEGGIRVPYLVRWKDHLPAGRKYEHPVIQLDIAATVLAAAGVETGDAALDGVNLLPHLTGQQQPPPHDALYWRFGSQMAVRQGDWKLVRPSRGLKEYEDIAREPMLFNLKDDIGEQRDLAAQHPDKVQSLQTAWNGWNAKLIPPAWPATAGGRPVRMP